MKTKINKYSKGDYSSAKPQVVFSETNIQMTIGEGESYRGSFVIKSTNEVNVRGLIYASSRRIKIDKTGFDGLENKITYTFDGRGLSPGDIEMGTFDIVCTGGEYSLHFAAFVEKPFIMTAYGKVQSLKNFAHLAMIDYMEAHRLFKSHDFFEILKYEDERVSSLYKNMRTWSLSEEGMEEFLVGTKQKERVMLSLPKTRKSIDFLSETRKTVMVVQKNTWGYLPVHVEVDGDFIYLDKSRFSTDDFVGNSFTLEFVIDRDRLHDGRNYARIILTTPYQTLNYDVDVLEGHHYSGQSAQIHSVYGRIISEYLPCVCGKKGISEWVEEALELIEQLHAHDSEDRFVDLVQAHILLRGNRKEEAKWVLDNFEYNRIMLTAQPELAAYYLFLSALLSGDQRQMRRISEELERLELRNDDSWMIVCMLALLSPSYREYRSRLEYLKMKHMRHGFHSLLFYTNCYICYQENTGLLTSIGAFELHVLEFACKRGMFTAELAAQLASLIPQVRRFDERLYRILCHVYDMFPSDHVLAAICTLLIKKNEPDSEDFKWYQMAVDQNLNIPKLYEYYMLTISEDQVKESLPRSIYLYFMHGDMLDYKKKALLYSNILTYEEESSQRFADYLNQMETFAFNQLLMRRINDRLRIIYKRFCNEEMMTVDQIQALNDICHAYSISTSVSNMRNVLVLDGQGNIIERVPYTGPDTVIFVHDSTSRVIWESEEGRFYADSIPYETKRLFYEPHFIEFCKRYMDTTHQSVPVTIEEDVLIQTVRDQGFASADPEFVFQACSRRISDGDGEEDQFLLDLAFHLFEQGYYNKTTLSYLNAYYYGSSYNMKKLWRKARKYDLPTEELAERIMTQMLFSDQLISEKEVFENYVSKGGYFRLRQAYYAYASHLYFLYDRITDDDVFELIADEFLRDENLPDICRLALIRFYSTHQASAEIKKILKQFMQDFCEKRTIFPFFLQYPDSWKNEMCLEDKTVVQYQSKFGGKVKIHYRVIKPGLQKKELKFQSEVLIPAYGTIYVKVFVLFFRETLEYYFEEFSEEKSSNTPRQQYRIDKKEGAYGRYQRLNRLISLPAGSRVRTQEAASYDQELKLAEEIFLYY